MAGNDGRVAQVTPDDAGPIIAITTWLFMIMMILSVIFRVVIKLFVRRKLKLDDYMVCGALVCRGWVVSIISLCRKLTLL